MVERFAYARFAQEQRCKFGRHVLRTFLLELRVQLKLPTLIALRSSSAPEDLYLGL